MIPVGPKMSLVGNWLEVRVLALWALLKYKRELKQEELHLS